MRRRRWVISGGAVATLLAVTAVVVIVGATLLALRGGEDVHRKPSALIAIFIRDAATSAQVSSLEAKIKTATGVEKCEYFTKQETLTRLADGRPEVMLPAFMGAASYAVRLKKGVDVRATAQQFFLESAVTGVWAPGLGAFPARTGIDGRVHTVGGRAPGLPRPYPASEVKVMDAAGRLVVIVSPDPSGAFRIKLLPGEYTVDARPTVGNPWFRPEHVRVSGGYSKVHIYAQIR